MKVGVSVRLAVAGFLGLMLAGCASGPRSSYTERESISPVENPLQCVPYVRDHSQVALYGDAYTWWAKAEGRFARSTAPSEGSVMVLYNYAGPNRAHVAVVREIVSPREIRIDHANWLDDGAIYVNDPVADVSPGNDWSQVRVFNLRNGAWGSRTYAVQGFIGPGPDTNPVYMAQNPAAPASDPIGTLLEDEAAGGSADLK